MIWWSSNRCFEHKHWQKSVKQQQLLDRSHYEYEEHYVVSDDGYITLLVRVINPLVERADLRGPPVMLYHGANIDQSAYLLSSSKQHHPEFYPRYDCDGQLTSSNRSLGFMLANNGYDVWLIGTRGSNELNQGYTNDLESVRGNANFNLTEENFELVKKNRKKYWSYGLDEIIKYEIRAQIDEVLRLTGANEVSLLSFSLSTPTTMAFLAANPDYARRVRVYFQMAPAIAADHFTSIDKLFFERLCPHFPTRGIGFLPSYSLSETARKLIIETSKVNKIRYSLIYKFITTLFGPSLKYHTNLERNLLAHIFQPVSFKSIKHYCQNSVNKKLTKFNFDEEKNTKVYNNVQPPVYNISRLEVQNWVVLSGTYDALADATTVQRLIEKTSTPKPVTHIVCPGFNHVDFQGAVENAKYVNLPILDILNQNSDPVENKCLWE